MSKRLPYNYALSNEATALQLSREYHAEKWNTDINNIYQEAEYYQEWLTDHFNLIDPLINTSTHIHEVSCKKDTELYHLLGIKVNSANKGIYIRNGRKYVVK